MNSMPDRRWTQPGQSLTVPMLIPDAAGQVAIDLGLQGGAHTPVSGLRIWS